MDAACETHAAGPCEASESRCDDAPSDDDLAYHRTLMKSRAQAAELSARRLCGAEDPENEVVTDAFPWLLNRSWAEDYSSPHVPKDILRDGARVAAVLDARQLLGDDSKAQTHLTFALMEHDLSGEPEDYLLPPDSVWQALPSSPARLQRVLEVVQQARTGSANCPIRWRSSSEIWVGRHRIFVEPADVSALCSRWQPEGQRSKWQEVARLLALYSIFNSPLDKRRNGIHLGLPPALRLQCSFELFASPLNAILPNGCFASKWPHVERQFGSAGCYPEVLDGLGSDEVLCVNPPFTDGYLEDVVGRLPSLKARFRLRVAIPIRDAPWRSSLHELLAGAQLWTEYFDASSRSSRNILNPTLIWEDPRLSEPSQPCAQMEGQPDASWSSLCRSPNSRFTAWYAPPSNGSPQVFPSASWYAAGTPGMQQVADGAHSMEASAEAPLRNSCRPGNVGRPAPNWAAFQDEDDTEDDAASPLLPVSTKVASTPSTDALDEPSAPASEIGSQASVMDCERDSHDLALPTWGPSSTRQRLDDAHEWPKLSASRPRCHHAKA